MLGNDLLRGEKVYLGANEAEHVAQWAAWFNNFDFSVWASFHLRIENTEQQQARYERYAETDGVSFGIFLQESDRYIGMASLTAPDWKNRCSMLGISIASEDDWGKGYGSDATKVILRYAFMEMNLHRVELGVFSYNARAIRAYEKIGFVHEGTLRQFLFRDGQYYDMHEMSILSHEWRVLNG